MYSNYFLMPDGNFISESELYHHGIKGQKWGVRRYQNADGTLTAAGKKRKKQTSSEDISKMSTDELRKKVRRLNNEQRYMDLTKSKSSVASKVADGMDRTAKAGGDMNKIYKSTKGEKDPYSKLAGQGIDAVGRTAKVTRKIDSTIRDKKDAKTARKKLENMNDDDLAKTVERLDLERQYSNLKKSDINRGKIKVNDVLDVAGDVLGITASAVGIAVGIKKLMNK